MSELLRALSTVDERPNTRVGPRCIVYDSAGRPAPLTKLEEISDVLSGAEAFVWLDVIDPQPADVALINEEFGLHPLAIEDALREHDRPKIDSYGDSWFVIVHAAARQADTLRISELAIFIGARFVVTVREAQAYPLDDVERRWENLPPGLRRDSGAMLYTLLDTVVDGYTAVAEAFEKRVETLEAALLGDPDRTNEVLLQIYAMRKELSRFRRAVAPVHEILVPLMRGDLQLFGADELPYYRDVYDHVTLVMDQLDSARELVNNARDTHISMVSHRQNEVTKQLTIVATIFMPLTFITGFFGQNFGWLVSHIESSKSFIGWGIGCEIVGVVALLGYFRYKRWN